MENYINAVLKESLDTKKITVINNMKSIIKAVDLISQTIKNGNKIMVCGNGGSASDSLHICGEFINRLLMERRPLPAMALSADIASITAISNDYSYDEIYSKQVEAFGRENDLLWVLTTSGNSKNILNAAKIAQEIGVKVLSFSGKEGGAILPLSDICLVVEKSETCPRIQETHSFLYHVIIELVEKNLFGEFK